MTAIHTGRPLIEVQDLGVQFGQINALQGVNTTIEAGEVTCVVGDNGAGKSVLIKVLCGVHAPTEGRLLLDGEPVRLRSARHARSLGILAVYQHLALVPLMSVWRNFFLGEEPVRGWGPFQRLDVNYARRRAQRELAALEIDIEDIDRPVWVLSGGQRQALAIARAMHFGTRLLILDEPTSALGVRQSAAVLQLIRRVADRGTAVVFVTPQPRHAYLIGDRFIILQKGGLRADVQRGDLSLDELTYAMAGGRDVQELELTVGDE